MSKDLEILSTPCDYDEQAKKAFHRVARKQLKRVADALGLDKSQYDLRSNKGGIAVSGEVTLHTDFVYIEVNQSAMPHAGPVLVRSCQSRKDMKGGMNNFVGFDALVNVDPVVDKVRGLCAR